MKAKPNRGVNKTVAELKEEAAKSPMVRMNFDLPESLRDEFRVKAAINKQQMGDLLRDFVSTYVNK